MLFIQSENLLRALWSFFKAFSCKIFFLILQVFSAKISWIPWTSVICQTWQSFPVIRCQFSQKLLIGFLLPRTKNTLVDSPQYLPPSRLLYYVMMTKISEFLTVTKKSIIHRSEQMLYYAKHTKVRFFAAEHFIFLRSLLSNTLPPNSWFSLFVFLFCEKHKFFFLLLRFVIYVLMFSYESDNKHSTVITWNSPSKAFA